jgi:hypothetical protein
MLLSGMNDFHSSKKLRKRIKEKQVLMIPGKKTRSLLTTPARQRSKTVGDVITTRKVKSIHE